jgi:beta-glucosidase
MQGDDLREGVMATAKHFLGYAVTEAGQNMAATAVGARELYDVYARPFEASIRLAGLGSVMASYSEFDGVPIHISHEILTRLLRGRMGFAGTVVSDYVGVGWAQTRQQVAATAEEVGARPRGRHGCRATGRPRLRARAGQGRAGRQGARVSPGRVRAPRVA